MIHIDTQHALQFDVNTFVGRSIALLGITGSGKTNTAAVLIEELLASGLPMTIADIEGEYWGLKERFEVLVAGRSEHSELLIGPENAAQVAEISVKRGISVILDLSEYTQEESYEFLVAYFTRLWEVAGKERKPYQIVLEEAHEWIPQGTTTPLKSMLTRIALRGRKRGLGIILMSQRSAKVEKDVLTQTSLLFLHKVVHPTDMKVYKDLIPLPPSEVEAMVGALQPGHVAVVHNHAVQTAHIRLRHTFHAGATPSFGDTAQPELRRIDESMLRELQALMTHTERHDNTEAALRRKIKALEEAVVQKDHEIAKRDEQITLLSRLTVQANGSTASQALKIEQAIVHHMHIPVIPMQSSPRVVEAVAVAPKAIAESMPINGAKIQALRRRLSQMSTRQSHIFKLLVERDVALSTNEIAAWLNLDRSTVNKNIPPEALFKLGLLRRTQHGHAYLYKAMLKEHLAKEFPGTNQKEVLRQLLH